MRKVKAAVVTGIGQIEIREYPYPELMPGGAIIKNLCTGICGTDKHTYQGHLKHRGGLKNEFTVEYPLVQGHETVGIIEEVDKGVTDYYGTPLKPGDRVVCAPDVVCGECYYCKTMSWYPWCESETFHNIGESHNANIYPHIFGGFSEYMSVWPKTNMFKVPEGLPDELAAFTEVMCVAYTLDKAKEFYAFDGEGFAFGATVVIQGAGPIGIAHIIKARLMGAGKIIVTDLSDYKLKVAEAFGADVLINVSRTTMEERVQIVKDETEGRGAPVIVDCAGVPEVVPEGIEMASIAGIYLDPGQFVEVGEININVNRIVAKSLRLVGMSNHAIPGYLPTMEMLLRNQDRFPWDKLFSHIHHALKNALIPIITVIGLQMGLQLGGAMVTESVFSIPGLGSYMLTAIKARDYPVVQGGVIFIACTFSLVNLVVDIVYAFIDPRIKAQYKSKKSKANRSKARTEVNG